jgi:hypothetical protein
VGVLERLFCVGVNVPDDRNVGVVERPAVRFAAEGVDERPDRLGVVLRLVLGVLLNPVVLLLLVLMIPLFGVVERPGEGTESEAGELVVRVFIIPLFGVVDRLGVELKLPVDDASFNFAEELGVVDLPTVELGVVGRLFVDPKPPLVTLVGVLDRRTTVDPAVLEGVVGRLFVDPVAPLVTVVGVVERLRAPVDAAVEGVAERLLLNPRFTPLLEPAEGPGALTLRFVTLFGVETAGFDGVVEREGVVGVRGWVLFVGGTAAEYLFPALPWTISRTEGDFALRGGEELANREGDCNNARMRDVGVWERGFTTAELVDVGLLFDVLLLVDVGLLLGVFLLVDVGRLLFGVDPRGTAEVFPRVSVGVVLRLFVEGFEPEEVVGRGALLERVGVKLLERLERTVLGAVVGDLYLPLLPPTDAR